MAFDMMRVNKFFSAERGRKLALYDLMVVRKNPGNAIVLNNGEVFVIIQGVTMPHKATTAYRAAVAAYDAARKEWLYPEEN